MESQGRTRVCGQDPQDSPGTTAHRAARALLFLLLLLPSGCLGVGKTPGTLPRAARPGSHEPCSPRATCLPSGPLLQQAPTTQAQSPITQTPPVTTKLYPSSVKTEPPTTQLQPLTTSVKPSLRPSCGFSYEPDPTLRDPEAMARRWPWMVSVRANGTHVCAGTIIAPQWVLAVAYCLTQRDVIYSVKVGSPWINQRAQNLSEVLVLKVIVNSRYRAQRYWSWVGRADNLGLLKLLGPLQYSSYVWPVCLPGPDYELKDRSVCTVTGWGLPKAHDEWPQSWTIKEKEVTVLPNKECEDFYHRFSKVPSLVRIINPQMFCARDTDRERFCYEVTGEPLVCSSEGTWYLVGMVSWGAGCKHSEAPPIFLRVSSYQSWIWDRLNGQPRALLAPSLLPALSLSLSLPAAL